VKWFRKAAEQGDAEAQNNLGAMYAQGQGRSAGLHPRIYVVQFGSDGGQPKGGQ
jgi:TPR repeat protein